MTTTRRRHFVTETDQLAAALHDAACQWPGLIRAQLVVRLALEGQRTCGRDRDGRRRLKLAAVRKHSGILTGAYTPHYLRNLREEWPD